MFLSSTCFLFSQCNMLICAQLYSLRQFIWNSWILFIQNAVCLDCVHRFWRRCLKDIKVCSQCCYHLPWEKAWTFFWINLSSPSLRMLCAMFGWYMSKVWLELAQSYLSLFENNFFSIKTSQWKIILLINMLLIIRI